MSWEIMTPEIREATMLLSAKAVRRYKRASRTHQDVVSVYWKVRSSGYTSKWEWQTISDLPGSNSQEEL